MVAAKLANVTKADAGKMGAEAAHGLATANLQLPKTTAAEAAALLSVSPRSVAAAKKVQEQAEEPLRESVERGEIAVSTAAVLTESQRAMDGLARMDRSQPVSLDAAIEAGKKAAETMKQAPELLTPSEAGKKGGRGKKVSDKLTLSTSSTSKDRLAARIKRDRPDIASRVEAGEFRSIRAAAIEAGIVRPPSPSKTVRNQ